MCEQNAPVFERQAELRFLQLPHNQLVIAVLGALLLMMLLLALELVDAVAIGEEFKALISISIFGCGSMVIMWFAGSASLRKYAECCRRRR